jgi:hypothetical protein
VGGLPSASIKFWKSFYISFCCSIHFCPDWSGFLPFAITSKMSELVIGDADNIFGMRCPEDGRGVGFSESRSKGNAKCHEKNSWRKGKASTKFSSSTIGRKPVEYKDILLPKSIYYMVCCQTPPSFHSLHTDCTTEHHLDLWYALSAKVEHSSHPRRSFAGVARTYHLPLPD